MREEILGLLEKGKELHEQLVSAYDESSPANILDQGNHIIEVKLPGNINGMLVILNADAKSKKYQPVDNLQQAIELFSNAAIQKDIDKAITNKELVGLSPCEDCFISVQEIFDASKCEIQSHVEQLNLLFNKFEDVIQCVQGK